MYTVSYNLHATTLSSIQICFDKIKNHTTNKISINMPTDITIFCRAHYSMQVTIAWPVCVAGAGEGGNLGLAREHGKTYLAVGVLG